ncbi:MAG: hypothetical protein OXG05_08340 [Gammaproteobacteria bacterium]|nr:hypothetical protein [Gammaproteobacteria bacterium]
MSDWADLKNDLTADLARLEKELKELEDQLENATNEATKLELTRLIGQKKAEIALAQYYGSKVASFEGDD